MHAEGASCEHAGYGEPGFLASYLGVQAHGILWPAPGAAASANWPIAPPMVSAKVRRMTVGTSLACACSGPPPQDRTGPWPCSQGLDGNKVQGYK